MEHGALSSLLQAKQENKNDMVRELLKEVRFIALYKLGHAYLQAISLSLNPAVLYSDFSYTRTFHALFLCLLCNRSGYRRRRSSGCSSRKMPNIDAFARRST